MWCSNFHFGPSFRRGVGIVPSVSWSSRHDAKGEHPGSELASAFGVCCERREQKTFTARWPPRGARGPLEPLPFGFPGSHRRCIYVGVILSDFRFQSRRFQTCLTPISSRAVAFVLSGFRIPRPPASSTPYFLGSGPRARCTLWAPIAKALRSRLWKREALVRIETLCDPGIQCMSPASSPVALCSNSYVGRSTAVLRLLSAVIKDTIHGYNSYLILIHDQLVR
jgi:hypothetical protein